ncbi:DNA repair protein RadC [Mycoplasmatota bacterium WC44]
MLIREIVETDRPRERARKYGINTLSNSELLAVLLRTGTKDLSAIEVSNNILNSIDQINDLSDITTEELVNIKGIGIAKSLSVLAAIELGKRINYKIKRVKVVTPKSIFNLLRYEMCSLKQEHFICLFLDSKNNIITKKTLFIGSLNISIVHPREIFKWAVKLSSASIIIVHNHPSGDPTPSSQDIDITKKIIDSGNIIGITVLDHIIIGRDCFLSLSELGYFK